MHPTDNNFANQILHFLSIHDQKYHLREIARKLSVDPGNLSREMRKLYKQGLVERQKIANTVYYSKATDNSDLLPSYSKNTKTKVNKDKLKGSRHLKDNIPTNKNLFITEDMNDKEIDEQIKKYLKSHEKEMVKMIQTLIRIPSVSGQDPEEKIALQIYKYAKEMNLFPKLHFKEKKRPNVVVELSPRSDNQKPNFLLIGHMDTVSVGEIENWRYYPFSGHISGGKIYGRGAQDMKAGIVTILFTLKAIKDLGLEMNINPRAIFVSNEEGGSDNTPIFDVGMEYLIEEGLIEGCGAIYAYGGSYNIGIGHRGVLRLKVLTYGESVHTGSLKWQKKEKGSNAVTAMAEILLKLEELEIPQTKHPSFPKHGNIITPGTMILHGGSAVSIVPDLCESIVEIRYLPGFPIKDIYHEIKNLIEKTAEKRGLKVEVHKFVDISAVSISPDDHIVQVLKKSCLKYYKETPGARGTGPANESFMLIKRGIPTVVFGPIGSGAHSDNENIEIHSLSKTIQIYLQTMRDYI